VNLSEVPQVVRLTYHGDMNVYCVYCFEDLRKQFTTMLAQRIGKAAAQRIANTFPIPS
jgi:hypothetical protein